MFYAVHKGREPGIYNSWDECKEQIDKFSKAKYKKCKTYDEAERYVKTGTLYYKEPPYQHTSEIDIYTDGSLFRRLGHIYSGYGFTIPSKNINKSFILEEPKTNNRAELMAILKAIELYKPEDKIKLNIYTDSQYSILICTSTGKKYRDKKYIKSGKPVINRDIIKKLVPLVEKYVIEFIHVSSHTNKTDIHSINNDIADTMAVKGAVMDYIKTNPKLENYPFSFGKYKNIHLSKIPKEYLEWIATSETFDNFCKKKEGFKIDRVFVCFYLDKEF